MNFDWSDLAFGSKTPINSLKAIFIAAPREISPTRFKQLLKEYLPAANIVLGIAKEEFIDGFEDQMQFRTLRLKDVEKIIEQVNKAGLPNKVYTLSYFQRELPYILQKLKIKQVLLVRGSWHHAFHTRPEYYTLIDRSIPFSTISPFADENEAIAYEERLKSDFSKKLWPDESQTFNEQQMLELAQKIARASYDYNFQTGAVLGRRTGPGAKKYHFLIPGFNKVVPYQTYAMHHGASREVHFSPPNDLNYYDTIHAEVKLLINAQRFGVGLKGTTLFINLMPCPTCSRMLAETDIEEMVYSIDHSDGYAIKMLEAAGKKVRRLVL